MNGEFMRKKELNFKPVWLIAPAIVVVWMLIMYFCKEVFPFGNATLVAYDLLHGEMPVIYHVYDAWHSGNLFDIFYNSRTLGGFGWSVVLTIFQPRYLFTLFWERAYLTQAIDVFFIVQFAITSFVASYSFSKIFPKLQSSWLVLVSLIYTFNGFSLLYLTNIDWLDIVLLYPLLIAFALDMIKGESKFPFFFVLAYILTFYTYPAFFVVLSLLIFGGLYIFILEEKNNRKTAIFNLGIGVGAALIAAFNTIIGFAKSIFSTARFEEGAYVLESGTGTKEKLGGFSGILSAENEIDIVAVFMFLGMSLAISSLVVLWVHFKKHKSSRKYTIFFTVTLVLFVFQIVFKAVMLIWHVGSYQKFPFRNGYMVAFFCCCIIAYYFSNFACFEGIKTKYNLVNFFSFVPAFFAAIPMLSYADVFFVSVTENFDVLNSLISLQTGCLKYPYACFAISSIACFLLIKLIKSVKLRNALTFVLALFLVGVNSFALIAETTHLKDGSLYEKEKSVYETVEQSDVFNRVNNTDGLMVANYPYIANKASISGWVHTMSADKYKSFADLGFSSVFTFVYDMGGTAFSKALLRITDTVSQSDINKDLYEKYDETEGVMKFYSNNYTLPVGLVCDERIKGVNADDFANLFEYQNAVYNTLIEDDKLFSKVTYNSIKEKVSKEKYYVSRVDETSSDKNVYEEDKDITTVKYTFDVGQKSALYLHNATKDSKLAFSELKVNGKKMHVFDGVSLYEKGSEVNTKYPNSVNKGILELGVFENETVEIIIKYAVESDTIDGTALYLMDLSKFSKLNEKFKTNSYKIEEDKIIIQTQSNENGTAFIPISYDENWICTVNGESVNPTNVMGGFIGLDVQSGDNEIVMQYYPKQAYISILLIAFGFLAGIAVLCAEKKLKMPKGVFNIAFIAFTVIFFGVMLVVYIVPVGYSLINGIIGLIK